jgi:NTP pyrophosphatase (non-canonical NTP hydrolase)
MSIATGAKTFPDPWEPVRDRATVAVLGKLLEELGEAASASSRCLIQGIGESEPVTGKPNREWLEDELADVLNIAQLTIEHFGLDHRRIAARVQQKRGFLSRWFAALRRERTPA